MNLHLGCGNKKLPNFVNVDIVKTDVTDIVDDVSTLKSFNNNSVNLIYACHVLEHFKRKEYKSVLQRWTELLIPSGILRLSVPDFRKAANLYLKNLYPLNELLGFLQGGQTHGYNFHYMNLHFNILENDLRNLGYKNIEIWNWREVSHGNTDDYSQSYLPHMDKENGELMSLNIQGVKI